MSAKPTRTIITILMDLLIVLAVLVTVSVVVLFFGVLSSTSWGEAIVKLADVVTIPFGVEQYRTPYGGVFAVDGALTIALYLLIEWGLSAVRHRS